ncbi:MAG: TlpA family protein disulfide reductase [Planctomycetaceae bacterium]|jgi:thiol-disulfide isomerase/thioredoxin
MTAVRALLCSAVLLSCGLTVSVVAGDEKPAAQPATAATVELQPGTWKDITTLVAKNKGKIVVVDVWSTSCAPCMQEFPGLVRLQQAHPEKVVCISFNVDYVGIKNKPADFYRPKVEAFLKKQQAQFVNILCTEESDKFFADQELSSIPAVYVYGTDGKLAKRFDESLLQEGREEAFTYEADIVPFVKQQLAGGK